MLRPCRLDPDLASGPGSGSGRLVQLLFEIKTDLFSSPKSQIYIRMAAMVAMSICPGRFALPTIACRYGPRVELPPRKAR